MTRHKSPRVALLTVQQANKLRKLINGLIDAERRSSAAWFRKTASIEQYRVKAEKAGRCLQALNNYLDTLTEPAP
jgi:hypothetical protein